MAPIQHSEPRILYSGVINSRMVPTSVATINTVVISNGKGYHTIIVQLVSSYMS